MFEKVDNCPICLNESFENKLVCEDHTVTHEKFAIVKCKNCGFLLTSPRPVENNNAKYYDHINYTSHNDKKLDLITIVYNWVRDINLRYKYKIIRNYKNHGKILDYGCGTGSFLEFMKKKNWEVLGVEINDNARKKAQDKELEVFANLKNIEEKFEIITAWHVLEHVHELNDTLENLSSKLKKKGLLIIALPNYKSYDQEVYNEFWAGYDVPRHLYHFDKKSIERLLEKHQLKIKEIKPLWFDAFYVSILSEKYRGRPSLFSALRTAWKSNQLAKQSGEYSSLIYIAKKKNEKKK